MDYREGLQSMGGIGGMAGISGLAATQPKQPQKMEVLARTLDQNNGRLSELIGRLRRVRNNLVGPAPESPENAGAVPTPSGAVNYLSNAAQNAEIMLSDLAALIADLETL